MTEKTLTVSLIISMILWVLLIKGCELAFGEEFYPANKEKIVHCVLGEARSQGYNEILGHFEAIRNRGTLKGVYGCSADYKNELPYMRAKGIIKMAYRAYEEAKTSNIVKGSDYWESTDFKTPYWAKDMELIAQIGKTKFYRD